MFNKYFLLFIYSAKISLLLLLYSAIDCFVRNILWNRVWIVIKMTTNTEYSGNSVNIKCETESYDYTSNTVWVTQHWTDISDVMSDNQTRGPTRCRPTKRQWQHYCCVGIARSYVDKLADSYFWTFPLKIDTYIEIENGNC